MGKRKDSSKTVVVFRQHVPSHREGYNWRGDLIAIFPEIAESWNGYKCQGYCHLGQHFSADAWEIIQNTFPATDAEGIGFLTSELEGLGYKLDVKKRIAQHHYQQIRKNSLKATTDEMFK